MAPAPPPPKAPADVLPVRWLRVVFGRLALRGQPKTVSIEHRGVVALTGQLERLGDVHDFSRISEMLPALIAP